jgi:hypothetical protein
MLAETELQTGGAMSAVLAVAISDHESAEICTCARSPTTAKRITWASTSRSASIYSISPLNRAAAGACRWRTGKAPKRNL